MRTFEENQMRRCSATKRDGQPCNAHPIKDDDRCLFHSNSPRVQEIRHRPKVAVGRKKLLSELARDYAAVEGTGLPKVEKIRLRKELAYIMAGLMKTLDIPGPKKKQEGGWDLGKYLAGKK
jgi:hypothetical protein